MDQYQLKQTLGELEQQLSEQLRTEFVREYVNKIMRLIRENYSSGLVRNIISNEESDFYFAYTHALSDDMKQFIEKAIRDGQYEDRYARIRQAEAENKLAPIELAILFHYRYIRIHPFEDGNGRIARLMVNYILSRHGLPMIVVRSKNKQEYLEALHQADLIVGPVPADGAYALLKQIRPFHKYMVNLITKEVEGDILFVTEKDENVWWYDGERIAFRTPTYARIIRALQIEPKATLAYMQQEIGINRSALQKMLQSLQEKNYIQNEENGVWRVFITPSI